MIPALITGDAPLTEQAARMQNPLALAFVGDAVHHLYMRTALMLAGGKVQRLHRDATDRVNAAAQAKALARVLPMLTETEQDIVRRGRNAHAHHGVPRRADPADYAQATALEALLGFLYLTGQAERLNLILKTAEASEVHDAAGHIEG